MFDWVENRLSGEKGREAVVRRLQIRCSKKCCKFHPKTSVLESLFNKATGLKACNSIKKKLQHRRFPVKFLRTPFFTEEFQWLFLRFNPEFSKEFGAKTTATVSN